MIVCQWIMFALLIFSAIHSLYVQVNGRKEQKPNGFAGAIASIIVSAGLALLYYKAGAFSAIF